MLEFIFGCVVGAALIGVVVYLYLDSGGEPEKFKEGIAAVFRGRGG